MKRAFGFVFSGFRNVGVLLFIWGAIIPFLLLIYFAFRKQSMMYFAGLPCLLDYIHMLNDGFISKLLFLPFSVAMLASISEHRQTANFLVRQPGRRRLLAMRQGKAFFFSALFAAYTMGMALFIAGLFTDRVNNWSSSRSFFYATHGYMLDISVWEVLLINFCKSFVSLLALTALMLLLCIRMKRAYAFLIILVLSAADVFGLAAYELSVRMNIQETASVYMQIPAQLFYFAVLPAAALLFIIASLQLARRKEFYDI